jgi:SAM-dependent methyltransferase
MAYRYVLGDSRTEADRLRAQARLWDPVSHALFDRLKIRRGARILEVGPGQGSLHLELRRRAAAPVDAVEHSPIFAARLRELCARDRLGAGRIWERDLAAADLPANHYDLIFARWVFLFLPEPLRHLKQLVRALRPGGTLALQDYHRETIAVVPRPPHFVEFCAADLAFFASEGGDASIGGRLPALYRRAKLDVVDITPTVMTGHPGSPTWEWMSSFFVPILDRYARIPPLTRKKANALRTSWLEAARVKTSLVIGPTVLDVVGRKAR